MSCILSCASRNSPTRFFSSKSKLPIPGVKNVLLVSSAKGGVGKSTIAVNLALSLHKALDHQPVGLLDADIFGPSIPLMLGLIGSKPEVDEKKRILPLKNHGIICMSMGFLVGDASAIVWRGLMVMSAIQQLIRQVNWGPLHTLVVDLPPGTGDVPLSLCQNILIDGAVIVTTPQSVAVADTRRGIEMFKTLKVPIYGMVENMTEFVCPNCGHHTPLFDHNCAAQSAGQELQLPVLARIPIDPRLIQSSDAGKPLVVAYPHSSVAQIYAQLAEKVVAIQKAKKD